VGSSGSGFNISSSVLPIHSIYQFAGSATTGLISTLAQTIAGQKTFTSAIIGDLTGIATTASYAYSAGYANTSGFATTSSSINVNTALDNSAHSLIFSPSISGSGIALSSNSAISLILQPLILSTPGLAVTSTTVSTSSSTGSLTVAGGVGIGGSLFLTTSVPSSLSGVIVNNGVITSGSWAGSTVTARYGGTGQTTYAKGDILVGIGNTLQKFAVGTDAYVLTADSTSAIGVSWRAASVETTVIGTPTDGVYTDGFFTDWTNNTSISNAFDDVNELLALISSCKTRIYYKYKPYCYNCSNILHCRNFCWVRNRMVSSWLWYR